MTQAPTPGPLSADDVKLLVKGDLLRVNLAPHLIGADQKIEFGTVVSVEDASHGVIGVRGDHWGPEAFAFIGRPDADGWMLWSGGENPVPGQRVEALLRDGPTIMEPRPSDDLEWSHGAGFYTDIIAFRLAPTAPVEARGSERVSHRQAAHHAEVGTDPMTAMLRDIDERLNRDSPDIPGARVAIHGARLAAAYAALRPQPSGETRSFVMSADDAPVWADGIVTDGERVAMAQKAEADFGGTYWATDDGGDGAVEWEPTHFIDLNALLSVRPAPVASGGQHSSGEGE